jgi:flagellar secretion chaperone FliS
MAPAARDEYLSTEVLTAAPQKLQLMLIEAAIRFGRRAEMHWKSRQNEAAFNALIRCQEIVSQLISGLAANLESPLVRQVSAVYAYVYRSLISAGFHHAPQKLADALRVLEIERETWLQVCERLGTKRADDAAESSHTESKATSPLAFDLPTVGEPISGFSFEA